jgi:glyoxalase family protein
MIRVGSVPPSRLEGSSIMSDVHGLHHVTAISGAPQRNLDFYRGVLGLRFVKKTVNFDDPGTYHLYYGDELGRPGSAMTFFPWERLPPGRPGKGEASEVQFAVPAASLSFWQERLDAHGVEVREDDRFGERRLAFADPDGLGLALVAPTNPDPRPGWGGDGVPEAAAIHGFHGVTLRLGLTAPTGRVLTELLDYAVAGEDRGVQRFTAPVGSVAAVVDIEAVPGAPEARQGLGSVHHVAFRVPDDATHRAVQQRIARAGFQVTPVIDRDYFRAIYFRTPGGVLFEVSTDEPGFTVDEPADRLGLSLRLPKQHEHLRARIERSLPELV